MGKMVKKFFIFLTAIFMFSLSNAMMEESSEESKLRSKIRDLLQSIRHDPSIEIKSINHSVLNLITNNKQLMALFLAKSTLDLTSEITMKPENYL